jgi:hypothetical protein
MSLANNFTLVKQQLRLTYSRKEYSFELIDTQFRCVSIEIANCNPLVASSIIETFT